jgi:O-acetylhomoserine/O-acetylserine sulfhydrylase-like pyridoxal-dependent enzyme
VIHSCTKFLGGHSDILAGSASVKNRELEDKVWQARKLVRERPLLAQVPVNDTNRVCACVCWCVCAG